MRKNIRTKLWILAGIAVCGFAGSAMATPLGTLNITNCSPNGGVTVSATTITWLPPLSGTTGCIATGAGTNVTYSGGALTSGTGTIKNLTLGGGGSVDMFMTFNSTPLDFILNGLGPGESTVCSGSIGLNQTCSPANSPFILTNLGANTGVSLTAFGTANDGTPGSSAWTGAFTTQLAGVTLAQVLATIGTPGGSITSTHSASFTVSSATIPEPATLSMMGVGLLGLGLLRRRKKS